MPRLFLAFIGLSACATACPALAQNGPQEAHDARSAGQSRDNSGQDDADEIVVTAGKPEGSVIGDIPPEITFNQGDIRSFGVSSLSDLIAELAPQTGSGQGRGGESPVVLLNGKRISSFAEIRDIPTEAIQRVEILPEEVALKYGYSANQKVVNVVLRKRFHAVTAEAVASAPTEGGQFSPEGNAGYLRISNGQRVNLAVKYQHSSALTEGERDITSDTPRQPYGIGGNITSAVSGAGIDPALNALLGRTATIVGVPDLAATRPPTLADFASGAVNGSDIGRYRTLLPETNQLTLNGVWARPILGDVSATFNATFTYNDSHALQGVGTSGLTVPAGSPWSPFAADVKVYRYLSEFGPLDQQARDTTLHAGTTLTGAVGKWNWSFTGNFDRVASRTVTERGYDLSGLQARLDALDPLADPFAPLSYGDLSGQGVDVARSVSNTGDARMVVTGSPFELPAGPVTTTFTLGGTLSGIRSNSLRANMTTIADLSRNDVTGKMSVDIPLASRKKNVIGAIGELTANFNVAYDRYSDLGGLRTLGAGLNWTPVKPVTFIASITKDEGAPTVQQLGNPLVTNTGVRVFDYVRGETVDIAQISGGSPNLRADDRRLIKLGMTLKPWTKTDLSLTVNYTNSRIQDPIATFPTATAAIEAAFPDRFTRDASGQLTQIDARPINFVREDNQQIRWGINFSRQLSAPPRPQGRDREPPSLRELLPAGQDRSSGDQQRDGDRQGDAGSGGTRSGDAPRGSSGGAGGGRPGGSGGGFGRGPGGRGTRLQLAVYHTVYLRDRILVNEGGPPLDLLNGDAINSTGGQPRHIVDAQAGLTHNGLGVRLSATWQSGTTVDGGAGSTQLLRFSDLTTINLRLFANLGMLQGLTAKWPFLRGSRLTLGVTNLFNQRLSVRDQDGDTPVRYQPNALDPLGRSVRISFRKLFF